MDNDLPAGFVLGVIISFVIAMLVINIHIAVSRRELVDRNFGKYNMTTGAFEYVNR